jgi:hypothetical protein
MSMSDESGRDAHRIGIEFVSDRSTRGGWRRVEFPIGLSCDTLGEKFRGKGDDGLGKCRCRMKAVGTHIESASSLFLIARRVADGGASSFPLV